MRSRDPRVSRELETAFVPIVINLTRGASYLTIAYIKSALVSPMQVSCLSVQFL